MFRIVLHGKYRSWKHIESLLECERESPHAYYDIKKVMSSTVADALTYLNNEDSTETHHFIRLFEPIF